ncbi:head GIN domain-containing protein [Mucilaginibacter pedocola]|uniref:Putative auto-transporter adhesin head GIN domain-containing protein n=1 Tax=Mucilaginibacter pedocola TaxID=1792845 RepID=A0A1S9PAX6_9SPHI|nr:head GIN domain-containing protein [Mucilaginibacter pedocola]OOQ58133.1 hypothetical protein BC343_10810 [Mucilaginibacter pedocola]
MKSLKKLILAAVLVAVNVVAFAKNVTEDRHLTGFSAVNVAGSFDVYITQGSSESVKVDAPSDIIGRIVTEVEGGTLKIYTKRDEDNNWSWHDKKVVIYVALKDVNNITLRGSGDVFFKEGLKASSLQLKLVGSGDITGKLNVKNLDSSIQGSGDITISGSADTSLVSVAGSGDFTGQGLTTGTTQVMVRGSGDARVNASEKIDASVVGSGDVHYTGSPKTINTSKAGSGSVSRM